MNDTHNHTPGSIKPSAILREAIGLEPERVAAMLKDSGTALVNRDGVEPVIKYVGPVGEKSVKFFLMTRLGKSSPWRLREPGYRSKEDLRIAERILHKNIKNKELGVRWVRHETYSTDLMPT